MGLFSRKKEERSLTFDAVMQEVMNYQGLGYPLTLQQTLQGDTEPIDPTFLGLLRGAYRGNSVVFACMAVRARLFSEARFQWRQLRNGRPGELFGTPDLGILETPWPNGTTRDLLVEALLDVDLSGNFFAYREGSRLRRLRPDWTMIVTNASDPSGLGADLLGYAYTEGGPQSGNKPVFLDVANVAHWAPNRDPEARFRGMSWLTPLVREIQGDSAAMEHKLRFFDKGATPNMVVTLGGAMSEDAFEAFVARFREEQESVANAYKTLFFTLGTSAEVVGSDMKQLDFKVVQGHGETRIAAAAGIPPVIVGLSEGLDAATYSNYAQARRSFADGTMRPLWGGIADKLATILPAPPGAHLYYDDRDIPFLQEDVKDLAEIQSIRAATAKVLVDAGFTPDSVIATINSDDFSQLAHTGLFSVQLMPATSVKGNVVKGEAVPTGNDPGKGKTVPTGGTNGSAGP